MVGELGEVVRCLEVQIINRQRRVCVRYEQVAASLEVTSMPITSSPLATAPPRR